MSMDLIWLFLLHYENYMVYYELDMTNYSDVVDVYAHLWNLNDLHFHHAFQLRYVH